MSCAVTGAAGFIGSHLAESLLKRGHKVIGIDALTDYYPRKIKLSNLSNLKRSRNFTFLERDLVAFDLRRLMSKVDYVFHLAAQPGVRASWGSDFSRYVHDNIMATQRLLEAAKESPIKKFVFASSSSVYGASESLATGEETIPRPSSPYGATKLAAENLCHVYHKNFDIPVVVLRYFTVYGPQQRPDMAFHKFISSISDGKRMQIYGDGSQSRDFTYVDDIVHGTTLAMQAESGRIFNVGSGSTTTLNETVKIIETLTGKDADIVHIREAKGDVARTAANISRIRKELGYEPKHSLKEGLMRQVAWQLALR